jgi:molybdate transport system substrate-binding protein
MNKFKLAPIILFVIAVLSFGWLPAAAQEKQSLTVLAASSLTDAFNEIGEAFKAANAGVDIAFSYGSSSTLATQLAQGAPADVFASANSKQMGVAQDAKRIAGKPRTFLKNRLILIVPAGNPANIQALRDLANKGVKLVIAAPNVPVRDYTNTMLDKLAADPAYGDAYKKSVLANVVSEEDNVRQVSAKVALGEADAGIVYRSDVTPDISDKVKALPIPDAINTIATYPIGITNDSANPKLAQAFVDYVLSDAGQDTLVKWGFISIRIPELPATVKIETDGKLHVDGLLLNPLALTADELKQNYAAKTLDVTYKSGEDTVKAKFTGALLWDILGVGQPNLNVDAKNDKLRLYILATGSDGYQSVISWGEVDPEFGNQPILVAYEQDGKTLDDKAGGPVRLVVPGDARGGRYVSGLVSLSLRHAPGVGK